MLVRSVTTSEPTWTEQDRAEILALTQYRASLCPCGCGHLLAETTSHEEGGPRFVVTEVACRARLALLENQRAVDAERGSENSPARLWRTEMKR